MNAEEWDTHLVSAAAPLNFLLATLEITTVVARQAYAEGEHPRGFAALACANELSHRLAGAALRVARGARPEPLSTLLTDIAGRWGCMELLEAILTAALAEVEASTRYRGDT